MIVSNYEIITGRDALFEAISSWRKQNPDCRGILTSGIEHHHVFRFTAVVIKPDGTRFSPALDIGELDQEGRIKRIITFFQELPAPPSHWPKELITP